ncbi:unnamed protein product, partial [Rotaria magnacalcarata]
MKILYSFFKNRLTNFFKDIQEELERKTENLTERLSAGANAYKTLYRKYKALEHLIDKTNRQSQQSPKPNSTTLSNETGLNEEVLVTLLRNSRELQQQDQQRIVQEDDKNTIITMMQNKNTNEEIRECPMCYWEFPEHLTLDNKKEHIE